MVIELIQCCQIADGCPGVRVLFAQNLFTELQGLFIQRLSLAATPE
jgi:hypothetical protein